jgi:uncharacterized membrane protein YfcA
MDFILVILLGGLVGISSALLGLGGNILIVPILPLISQLPLPSVIATGILTVFLVTLFNVINFYRQNLIDIKIISLLFFPTSLASFISSYYAHLFSEVFIRYAFLFIMGAMLLKLFFPPKKHQTQLPKSILIIPGIFSGLLAGLTGVGTGIILAPLLVVLSITDEKKISPSINFLIMVSCFFSSINYLFLERFSFPQAGLVRLDYALGMALVAMITSQIGRRWNRTITSGHRKLVIALMLIVLMLKTILT